MLPRLLAYGEKLNSFKLFSNSPLLSMSRWSGPLFLTMDHIIKIPASAQSKEACHTVQMAFSLTATARSPLCHMLAKPVPQIQSRWVSHHPGRENSLKISAVHEQIHGHILLYNWQQQTMNVILNPAWEMAGNKRKERGKIIREDYIKEWFFPQWEWYILFRNNYSLVFVCFYFLCSWESVLGTIEFHVSGNW